MHEVGKGVESEIHLRKLAMKKHFSPGAGLVCNFGLFGFANGLADFFYNWKGHIEQIQWSVTLNWKAHLSGQFILPTIDT